MYMHYSLLHIIPSILFAITNELTLYNLVNSINLSFFTPKVIISSFLSYISQCLYLLETVNNIQVIKL